MMGLCRDLDDDEGPNSSSEVEGVNGISSP